MEVDRATGQTVFSLVESELGVEFDRLVPKSIISNYREWAVWRAIAAWLFLRLEVEKDGTCGGDVSRLTVLRLLKVQCAICPFNCTAWRIGLC